jgi:hypothetical protein
LTNWLLACNTSKETNQDASSVITVEQIVKQQLHKYSSSWAQIAITTQQIAISAKEEDIFSTSLQLNRAISIAKILVTIDISFAVEDLRKVFNGIITLLPLVVNDYAESFTILGQLSPLMKCILNSSWGLKLEREISKIFDIITNLCNQIAKTVEFSVFTTTYVFLKI